MNSALADGSYGSNKNFKYLYEKKILPGIKIRKNSHYFNQEHQYKE